MPLTTKGTPHLYGITGGVAVIADATVLSFSLTSANKNVSQTLDERGNEIERRYDDVHRDGSITIRPRQGFVTIVPGQNFVYDGVTFEIVSVGEEETQSDFKTITYTILSSEYISY